MRRKREHRQFACAGRRRLSKATIERWMLSTIWSPRIRLELFGQWLSEAEASEPNDANAAALATSTPDGPPSVRMVLVKRADERGFCFFTNAESKKGMELQANPRAALCFHWKSLRRQVRVEGRVIGDGRGRRRRVLPQPCKKQPDRRRLSQQSRPLGSREELEVAIPQIRRGPSGRGTSAALLARLLRACGPDRVLDIRRKPPSRPLLVYPRRRCMEENPALSMIS